MERVATVFGGTGFIGRYIVRRLAREGWVVRVAVRDRGPVRTLKPLGHVGQIAGVVAPVQDPEAVARAVQGVNVVINLVGILAEARRQTFDAVQHRGAGTVAEAAAAAGVERLVHISAIGADSQAASAYARSKSQGEEAVKTAFPKATILRPSIVIGPEDNFFNRFAGMARLSPALPLIGGGKTKFQPVYVGDVADAAMAALKDKAAQGKTFELGGPRVYTFRELMELTLEEIHRKRFLLPVPFAVAEFQASILELLPNKPLTRDQVLLLRNDNVVSEGAKTFKDLGLTPQAIEVILPTYLQRYCVGGRLNVSAQD